MDLLNISYTKESSVLTKGEMSFTLYENKNMANTRNTCVQARLYTELRIQKTF